MKIKWYLNTVAIIAGLVAIVMLGKWLPGKDKPSDKVQHYSRKCYLAEGCSLDMADGHIKLDIQPSSLPPLKALQLKVELKQLQAEQVSVEFVGKDMKMDGMPFILERQGRNGSSEHYSGEGSIAFCTTDSRMVWLARVSVKTAYINKIISFELYPEADN